jgi:aryl-alcohol dehydrogenase-like predicted oxidoreductase
LLNWGDQLARIPAGVRTLAQWNDVEAQVVAPRTGQVLRALDRALSSDEWLDFRGRYVEALEQLLMAIRDRAAEGSRAQASALHRALDALLPEARRGESLSRKALWVLASTPGVTSVLVGMREPEYVDDALGMLDWEPLDDPERALRALAEARI